MAKDTYKHTRIDETTGEENCFFPMEITDPCVRSWAKEQGYEITGTILGFRKIEAAMIPCKEKAVDKKGNEFFLPTPFEVQKFRYCQLIKDEMKEQEITKQDGRCLISDGKGSIKRCPLRIPNPEYTPENGQQKTISVRCEGCKYEPYKSTHTMISVPSFDLDCEEVFHENLCDSVRREDDDYIHLKNDFVAYVHKRNPKLTQLAELLSDEISKTDIAAMLGVPRTTINNRIKKIQNLLMEFLDIT